MTAPQPHFTAAEMAAMEHALQLAGTGVRGANPLVGAVILNSDGAMVASGAHHGAGTDHAEVAALKNAARQGADPAGCTMVVTLEPCNHTGRTGPCAAAVAAAGIRRVVHAASDPNPEAAGGAAWLAERGVDVAGGLLAGPAEELNRRWIQAMQERRPFVTVKVAHSLDAQSAAADGSSQWITGPHARADGHTIRSRVDAVLVGTGTVLADDPRLTARVLDGSDAERQPLRAVMGLRDVPEEAAIRGDGFVHLRTQDPVAALGELYGRGVRHVLVEGGPQLIGVFLMADLADELFSYIAPMLLGSGIPAFQRLGVATLTDAHVWRLDPDGADAVAQLGDDVRLHFKPITPPPAATVKGR
ncbi:bifunctional diaminohydroxyphosphoribosylaminopyrimidine deaminase/5-amino-6-(5-phosphoribosylamino)uracil reductase RibD [Arthrobacter sp. JZ12]|uniref:bifunctional diaminohydroxyphosphoribosylaminopyrimidine deaminase/5-amino-6-(5-phosphoribosylamino)uracil reductase RibD n=1 Tax=Arthrobacter sp. JZ12 TaxID=2654190 RepID=UPI002B46E698|nr:bifunctional diaminohydroxyphosphoribosylaminopyrimidine deaminase/5-amino-6-(5-phosphoribosylamino)uracil reductase RibD [Arthrobacter sp. JZ12]WRH24854.1 bifunctional diaminohydroxyphosphoribosylaminopyrimidine deaminase/5-amino-6-(5-phosphoribosylamino)uracil reductase RibD [Arthrobacter sp. JZ12]